jgi:GTP-binding protein
LPQIIALSRMDVVADRAELEPIQRHFEARDLRVFPISSVTGEGMEALLYHLRERLLELPKDGDASSGGGDTTGPVRITLDSVRGSDGRDSEDDPRRFSVTRESDDTLVVSGKGLERVVAMTDMENEFAVRRLQRRLERVGSVRQTQGGRGAGGRHGPNPRRRVRLRG